ncbi:MAG: hypothetical protein Q9195_008333 [Heterodermia aff. obscurata]
MRGSIFALQLLGLLQLGKVSQPYPPIAVSGSEAGLTGRDQDSDSWGPPDNGARGLADLIDTSSDPLRRLLRKRASLECKKLALFDTRDAFPASLACVANLALKGTTSETCYSLQGRPICVDDQTNDFRLDDGTIGNLDTGDYTLPDGQEGNLDTGLYPILAFDSASAFDSATASPITIITTASDSYLSNFFATSTSATESAAAETEAASSTFTPQTSSLTTSVDSILATETEAPSSIPTSGTNSSTTSGGSSVAAETEESSSSTLTPQTTTSADSNPAAETSASSSSTHPPQTTSSTTSPTTSAQAFQGAAARYPTPNLIFLAAMGLRVMF